MMFQDSSISSTDITENQVTEKLEDTSDSVSNPNLSDNAFSGSSAPALVFSALGRTVAVPAATIIPMVSSIPQQVDTMLLNTFLRHIGLGEQSQAQALLQQTPKLALVPGTLTDIANRTFKNITALQYAVWALDWHLWTMLRQYLSPEAQQEQLQGLKTGSWVSQYGESVSWQNLLDAMQKTLDFCDKSRYSEANTCWNKEVGTAQRLLPAHVIHEYCHPSSPFHPCPDFKTRDLPRNLKVEVYKDSKWQESTWKDSDGDLKLGSDFAFVRSSLNKAWYVVVSGSGGGGGALRMDDIELHDRLACHTLLVTRAQQRDQLLTEVLKERPALGKR